jgi:hypothetical protein
MRGYHSRESRQGTRETETESAKIAIKKGYPTWSSSRSDEDGNAPSKHPNASSSPEMASRVTAVAVIVCGGAGVGDMELLAAASWSDSFRIRPSASSKRDCAHVNQIKTKTVSVRRGEALSRKDETTFTHLENSILLGAQTLNPRPQAISSPGE